MHRLPILLELARQNARSMYQVTSGKLAEEIDVSQQTIERWLSELSEEGLIERTVNPKGQTVRLTLEGIQFLRSIWRDLDDFFGAPPAGLKLTGHLIAGYGEGGYYVKQESYKEQFKEKLGFEPYPGTLDLKLDERSAALSGILLSSEGERIDGFTTEERSFGDVKCFPAKIKDTKAGVVIPFRSHHRDDILEIISPMKLRDEFGLEDGDELTVEVEV